jgi:NADH-quinone oxidoreductase subunit G
VRTLNQFGLSLPDHAIVHTLARAMGVDLGTPTDEAVRGELLALGGHGGARPDVADVSPEPSPKLEDGTAVLATWPWLLDRGRLQDGEPHLAGTARTAQAFLSATTAKELGVVDGAQVTVSSDRGSITLPVATVDMPDRVVFLPTNSDGSQVRRDLAPHSGVVVKVAAAESGADG